MPTPQEILNNQIEISELFHVYGELLSDRQRTFIRLYYDENLSLSEIAAQHAISRQAVHDAIKHGRRALSRYETTLHLLDLKNRNGFGVEDPVKRVGLTTILEEMETALRTESGDVRGRLLAQLASLRELLDLPPAERVREKTERAEEAAA